MIQAQAAKWEIKGLVRIPLKKYGNVWVGEERRLVWRTVEILWTYTETMQRVYDRMVPKTDDPVTLAWAQEEMFDSVLCSTADSFKRIR